MPLQCAALDNGLAVCWGDNARGELGDNATSNLPIPVMVTGLNDVAVVGTGSRTARAAGNVNITRLLAACLKQQQQQLRAISLLKSNLECVTPQLMLSLQPATRLTIEGLFTCGLLCLC